MVKEIVTNVLGNMSFEHKSLWIRMIGIILSYKCGSPPKFNSMIHRRMNKLFINYKFASAEILE